MVDAINRIEHIMGLETIAEFVENEAILCRLREIRRRLRSGIWDLQAISYRSAFH
ncbi:MAG: hypothetical protein KZQ60_17390 [Candidatus Thiodiazotropha sp. (ex Lucinoma aequizonata)]|nr:hypothetical protein [Candidatus Thiodiazotropha sp. (ex Lucinoma aequizonata)]